MATKSLRNSSNLAQSHRKLTAGRSSASASPGMNPNDPRTKAKVESAREILAKLKTLIRCTICQEDISNPMCTPCDHYFCSECINEYLSHKTKESDPKTGKKAEIKCPNCSGKITKRSLTIHDQLNQIMLTITATNEMYKSFNHGVSVIAPGGVILSSKKLSPTKSRSNSRSPQKSRSKFLEMSESIKANKSSKNGTRHIEENDNDEDEEEDPEPRIVAPKLVEKPVESDTKRKRNKRPPQRLIDSDSDSDGSNYEPEKRKQPKLSRAKSSKTRLDSGSDASSVSKTSTVSKKKKPSTSKDDSKKTTIDDSKASTVEPPKPPQPPASPTVKPKALPKVRKTKSDSKPPAAPATSNPPKPTKPISVTTTNSPTAGRTKLPLASPLKRNYDQPVDLDSSKHNISGSGPTLEERYRQSIAKVSSSTPVLGRKGPPLESKISPVTVGLAMHMSDEEETLVNGSKKSNNASVGNNQPSNRAIDGSSVDELLKEVEKRKSDCKSLVNELDDDMPIKMDAPRQNYSRRVSVSSEKSSGSSRPRSGTESRFNAVLNQKTVTNRSMQTDEVVINNSNPPLNLDEIYDKLVSALQHLVPMGLEMSVAIAGVGTCSISFKKSLENVEAAAVDKKSQETQTEPVKFRNDLISVNKSIQAVVEVEHASIQAQNENRSEAVQTDDVQIKPLPELIEITSSASVGTQTQTLDQVAVGRESKGNNSKNDTNRTNGTNDFNYTTVDDDETTNNDDMGSDFSQSILKMLDEEQSFKCSATGELLEVGETPPKVLERRNHNDTTLSSRHNDTSIESSRRNLMSTSRYDFDDTEIILESDPE